MKAWWRKLFTKKTVEEIEAPYITFGRIRREHALEYAAGKTHEKIYVSSGDYCGLLKDIAAMSILYNKPIDTGVETLQYYTSCGQLQIIPISDLQNGEFRWDEPKRYRSIVMGACKFCGTDPGEGILCQNCGASTAWN